MTAPFKLTPLPLVAVLNPKNGRLSRFVPTTLSNTDA